MADEGADEVKVFRRTDAEDLETNAQSSHQLAEDKKDVVLETELESRPNGDPLIGARFSHSFIVSFFSFCLLTRPVYLLESTLFLVYLMIVCLCCDF